MKGKYLKIILFWFLLLALALINATIRETTYKPFLEPYIGIWAHQLSSLFGVALFFFAIYHFIKRSNYKYRQSELWMMGLIWTLMTIVFEVFMNAYIRHLNWQEIIRTYYFWRGETWIFVLLSLLVSPLIAYKIQAKTQAEN